jgi:hypothetical protein
MILDLSYLRTLPSMIGVSMVVFEVAFTIRTVPDVIASTATSVAFSTATSVIFSTATSVTFSSATSVTVNADEASRETLVVFWSAVLFTFIASDSTVAFTVWLAVWLAITF